MIPPQSFSRAITSSPLIAAAPQTGSAVSLTAARYTGIPLASMYVSGTFRAVTGQGSHTVNLLFGQARSFGRARNVES